MARSVSSSTSAYFSSPLTYDLPSNWTLLTRVKNMAASGNHQILIGKKGSDGKGWAFGRISSGEFGMWLFGTATITGPSAGFPTDSSWHAYAVTKDTTTATFYRDSATALGTGSAGNCAVSTDTTHGVYVGAMNDSGSSAFISTAEVAEFAIFSRVLTSGEITQWMNGDSPSLYSTGLIHYWKLDAASGNESATVGGVTLTQVGTVASTTHPIMNYGGSGASAAGGTGTSSGSGSGGVATGGAGGTGSFTTDAMENNSGAGLLASVTVNWTWYQGSIGAAPTSMTHGSGTTNSSGILSLTGLPLGAGFLLVRTTDSAGVYYQPGTVA